MPKKKAPKKAKVVRFSKYGSAYKLDPSGYLLYAALNTDGSVDDNWNRVELSAIEGELDVKKFRASIRKKLGKFKIAA